MLAAFDGITDRLIPLFAIGAFLTFTMSQSGMVAHWRKNLAQAPMPRSGAASWLKLGVNAVGAVATLAALLIIIVAKFTAGGWITIRHHSLRYRPPGERSTVITKSARRHCATTTSCSITARSRRLFWS